MIDDKNYDTIFAMPKEALQQCLERIYAKAAKDPDFKKRLLAAPTEVLTNEGVKLQPNIRFQTVNNEQEAQQLAENVIPFALTKKAKGELSLNELNQVAGGYYRWSPPEEIFPYHS